MRPVCSLVLVLTIVGCGSEAPVAAAPVAAAPVPAAPVPTPVVVAPAPAGPVAAADDGKVGVEVCDEYVAVHRACIATLAEEEQKVHGAALEEQRLAWVQARGDAKAGAGLAESCAAARTAAKVALPECKGW